MRKILFRAKRTDNKEWIEGSYIESVVAASPFGYITPSYPTEPTQIYTVTLGQWTDLYDKNDKRIFEGDIINIEYPGTVVENAVIEYVGTSFYGATDYDDWELDGYCELEIIDNIHDNPELANN